MQSRRRLLLLAAVAVVAVLGTGGVAAAGERSAKERPAENLPTIIVRSVEAPAVDHAPAADHAPGADHAPAVDHAPGVATPRPTPTPPVPELAAGEWVVTSAGRFATAAAGVQVHAAAVPDVDARYEVAAIFPLRTAAGAVPPREHGNVPDRNGARTAPLPVQSPTAQPAPAPPPAVQDSTKKTPPRAARSAKATKVKKVTSQPHRATTRKAKTQKAGARKSAAVEPQARKSPAVKRAPAKPVVKARDVPVAQVRGIAVHRRIAGRTLALLRAADRANLRLGGWGYRSTKRQIQLRRDHCGRSRYALYRMPAGRCWPATAPPGKSLHERGLAIDFYVEGRKGRPRPIVGTREFRWLKRNAAKYGFYNLPSEAWHWSVNGR